MNIKLEDKQRYVEICRWIPVDLALPPDAGNGRSKLVFLWLVPTFIGGDSGIVVGEYDFEKQKWDVLEEMFIGSDQYNITHWMPLAYICDRCNKYFARREFCFVKTEDKPLQSIHINLLALPDTQIYLCEECNKQLSNLVAYWWNEA